MGDKSRCESTGAVFKVARELSILTCLLKRAVPMQIKQARVIYDLRFYIYVPYIQFKYWKRFKERYPGWLSLARKHNVEKVIDVACPEFNTLEDLLEWLSDVLELTTGERNLLYLDTERRVDAK